MRNFICCLLVSSLLVTTSGCATVVSGKTQDLVVRSRPPGADILIDGMISGTTPMIANVMRRDRHTVKIWKDGYREETRATTRGFNWWFLGNLILGGVIGLIVDPITGAIYEVEPDTIYVELVPETDGGTEETDEDALEGVRD